MGYYSRIRKNITENREQTENRVQRTENKETIYTEAPLIIEGTPG